MIDDGSSHIRIARPDTQNLHNVCTIYEEYLMWVIRWDCGYDKVKNKTGKEAKD